MSLILSDLEPATALQLRGKLHPPARRLYSRSPEGCSPPGASLVLGSVAVCADFFIAWRRKCDCFIVSGRTGVVLGEHGIRVLALGGMEKPPDWTLTQDSDCSVCCVDRLTRPFSSLCLGGQAALHSCSRPADSQGQAGARTRVVAVGQKGSLR